MQIADVSFAASANEIWMALLTGACLTIAPPGLPDLMALVRQIESDNVTMLFLSGGLFRLFVEVSLETLHIPDCVVVSGDFVNPRLFSVAAQAGKAKIFNGLGCTENSAISSLYHVQSEGQLSSDSPVPVGTALPLVEMVVFNERLQPCTCGEYGELFIAGAGVALGYSDPQLTAERFISIPYQGTDVLFIVPTIAQLTTRIAISSWSEEATIFVKFVASASISPVLSTCCAYITLWKMC